jgi:hypothetical protein
MDWKKIVVIFIFVLQSVGLMAGSIEQELQAGEKIEKTIKSGNKNKILGGEFERTVSNPQSEINRAEKKHSSLLDLATQMGMEKKVKKAKELKELKNENKVEIKILLTPFINESKNINAADIVFKRLKKLLEKNKYIVSPKELSQKISWNLNIRNLGILTNRQLGEIAKKNGYNYILVGTIKKFSGIKDFRLGNLLAFPLGIGMVLYGHVKFSLKIVNQAGKKVYENSFNIKKKNLH